MPKSAPKSGKLSKFSKKKVSKFESRKLSSNISKKHSKSSNKKPSKNVQRAPKKNKLKYEKKNKSVQQNSKKEPKKAKKTSSTPKVSFHQSRSQQLAPGLQKKAPANAKKDTKSNNENEGKVKRVEMKQKVAHAPKANLNETKTNSVKLLPKKRKAEEEEQVEENEEGDEEKQALPKKGLYVNRIKRPKPNAEMIEHAKYLWEKLRQVNVEQEERDKVMEQIMKTIKGKIQEVIFKHDASRIIQTCLKYGNEDQHKQITEELKGRLLEITKSHYAHFLAIKLFKYCKEKHVFLKELYGHFPELIKHKEAAPVLEYIWTDVANPLEKSQILMEFYGTEFMHFKPQKKESLGEVLAAHPEKKDLILKSIEQSLNAVINKGAPLIRNSLFHKLLYDYFTCANVKSIQSIIQNLEDNVVEIIHTREGALAAVYFIAYGSAKTRKTIIKGLKGYITKVCLEEYGHLLILKILSCVDDTIFVSKSLLAEMKGAMKDLILDKNGHLVLLYILAPEEKKYLHPTTWALLEPTFIPSEENPSEMVCTSKKANEVRQTELLQFFSEDVLNCCEENVKEIVTSRFGSAVFYEAISKAQGDKQRLLDALLNLIQEDPSILVDFSASRLIKKLIKFKSTFANSFAEQLKDKHEWAIQKGSSFVILALMENEETSSGVKKELSPHKEMIEQKNNIPGVPQILQLLN